MALSYNLGYQESISVHPTRRQNFAGKVYLVFPNIWEWVVGSLWRGTPSISDGISYFWSRGSSEEMYFWKAASQLFTQRRALRNCCLRFEVMVADSWQSASPSICFASNSFFSHQKTLCSRKLASGSSRFFLWHRALAVCLLKQPLALCLQSPLGQSCIMSWIWYIYRCYI